MPDYQIARSWLRTTLKNFGKILEVVQPSAISSALFAQIQLSLLVLAQHYVQRHPITLCPHFSLIIISNDKIFSIKHDLARSCFKFWLKIGDEGDKISRKKLARR